MKKLLSILLSLSMLLSLCIVFVGCNGEQNNGTNTNSPNDNTDQSTDRIDSSSGTEQEETETNFQGLEFKLSNDGTYYSVTGIGTYTEKELRIPSTYNGLPVKTIYSYAFKGCKQLTSAIIDNIWLVGVDSFKDCDNLKSVIIGDSVTSIDEGAFEGCDVLSSISISDNVINIGEDAFYNTSYYNAGINWENNVLYVGKYLLDAKTDITGIYNIKPDTLCLADYAFWNCEDLSGIVFPNSLAKISSHAFGNCENLCDIELPQNLVLIDSYAFYNCDSLTNVLIPDSVTTIEMYAFDDCRGIKSLTIGKGITTISRSAFSWCNGLENVYYTGNVENWCKISFWDDEANPLQYTNNFYISNVLVEDLIIPNSVTKINEYAFYGLESLKSIEIPVSVTTIGYNAFTTCSSLKKVYYKGDISSWCQMGFTGNSLFMYADLYINDTIVIELNIPEGTTQINACVFEELSSLTSVKIPKTVTIIGEDAFNWCNNLTMITFDGTMQEWNKIEKKTGWNYSVAATEVICLDGVVALDS